MDQAIYETCSQLARELDVHNIHISDHLIEGKLFKYSYYLIRIWVEDDIMIEFITLRGGRYDVETLIRDKIFNYRSKKAGGGYNVDALTESIILEKEDFTEDQWKTLYYIFNYNNDKTTRIVIEKPVIETWSE